MIEKVDIGEVALNVLDRGRGDVLLLVHGFPLDHTMWRGQIDPLSEVCRVLAPDLRGFGRSDVTEGTVTMAQMADDLARLLDALKVTAPVTLVGLSMGGYVAWQFWQRHAGRLARLILCDTRAAADTDDVAQGRREMAERVVTEGSAMVAAAMLPKLFAPATLQQRSYLVEATRQVILRTSPAAIAATQRGMAEREDMTTMLSRITVPALVLCGQWDAISGPAEMQQIAASMAAAEFREIAGAGHMAPLENADQVNRAIRDFLAR